MAKRRAADSCERPLFAFDLSSYQNEKQKACVIMSMCNPEINTMSIVIMYKHTHTSLCTLYIDTVVCVWYTGTIKRGREIDTLIERKR